MLPIPIGTNRPQRRTPYINIILIAANFIIFLLSHQSSHHGYLDIGGIAPGWEKFLLYPTAHQILTPTGLQSFQPQLYQFITYQFLHEGWAHLLGNMLFLYVFGNALNDKLGHFGYLLFYLTGGILAGCGQVLTSVAPTLGASGAISAVTGGFLVLLPRTEVRVFLWIFFYVDVFEIPSMWFILFSVVWDAVSSQMGYSSVAHYAHLAGNVSGFLIALLLLYAHLVQRDHYDLLALFERRKRRREYEKMVSQGFNPFTAVPVNAPVAIPPVSDPRITELREEINQLLRAHRLVEATDRYLILTTIDSKQVLPPQDQLDVANQLMADAKYQPASQAYEDYLRLYLGVPQTDQVQLILGLIYARYLPQPDRAKTMLRQALATIHDPKQRQLAEGELQRLEPPPATT